MRIASAIAFAGLLTVATVAATPAHLRRSDPPQVRLSNLLDSQPASLAMNDSTLFRAVDPKSYSQYVPVQASAANFTVTVPGPDSASANSSATLETDHKYTVKASWDSDHHLKIEVVKDNG
ncbi:MAG: DUF4397 domain-containing protein [Gemmatimonadales bacterium]